MNIQRCDIDGNTFYVEVDGDVKYTCYREYIEDPKNPGTYKRGHWLVSVVIGDRVVIIDRDQYSNDILERISIHEGGRPMFFTKRVWFDCRDREQYELMVGDTLKWSVRHLEGDWVASFESWENRLVLERV